MPVILTTSEWVDLRLAADAPKALDQRPLPDDALKIVASGEKENRARPSLRGFASPRDIAQKQRAGGRFTGHNRPEASPQRRRWPNERGGPSES